MPGTAHNFCLSLITLAAVITVPPLVGWAQKRHWLPHYEVAGCSAYQRGVPHCRDWRDNARKE